MHASVIGTSHRPNRGQPIREREPGYVVMPVAYEVLSHSRASPTPPKPTNSNPLLACGKVMNQVALLLLKLLDMILSSAKLNHREVTAEY
ncbi:hypothetical protein EI94DRAFT_1814515 [Lactarius quietus]|nr:hypothetical protein EI94DRAFT_1814515 [Lactarius quietus]